MFLLKPILTFFDGPLGKKTLNIFLIVFGILAILHFSGIGRTLINQFSGVTSSITKMKGSSIQEVEKEEEYVNNLKTFDNKMMNILKYYTLDSDSICYQEIKERNKSITSSNQGFNINYIPLINGSTELKRTIVCNIYNSTISDIYIEIPYELTSEPISKIALDFIDLYTQKGYKIHLVYKLDKLTDLQKHRNVMKFTNSMNVASISVIYALGTTDNLDKIYKLLESLKEFYDTNYGGGLSATQFNFWVDFKYKNIVDYKGVKFEGMKSWYLIQGFSEGKSDSVEKLVVNTTGTKVISANSILQIKDDFFESFGTKKVNFTDELYRYIDSQSKLFELYNVKGNFLININIKKGYVDVIDWPTINQLLNHKFLTIITPNSQALVKNLSYDEQVERLVKEYETILTEKDILFLYYKYRNLYLESKK